MSPESSKQKRTACMVLAIREGKIDKKKFPRAAGMMKSMSIAQLRDMCKSPVKE